MEKIKDHEIREFVNTLKETAISYHDYQSLRDRICRVVLEFIGDGVYREDVNG